MKILHIIPNLQKGGAERLVLDIINELQNQPGIELNLITFFAKNEYEFLSKNINWKVIYSKTVPSIFGKPKIEILQLQEYIETFQPDVVHSHLFESEIVLAQIKFPKKTKRIVHFHDNMGQMNNFSFKTFFSKSSLTDFYERWIVLRNLQKKAKLICISKNTLDFAKKNMPSYLSKILLSNAIDLNRFHYNDKKLPSNEITIIGSLVDKKGQKLAIDCIAELKNRGVFTHLNLIGEGPNRKELQNQIVQLSLQNYVTLIGNVEYPEKFLQKSDLYLHTAEYEPFGLVIIEAMACGLPVVCTDGKGNRDLIQEGENGFMVWERDPEILADKIELLLKNDKMRIEMGQKAHAFAQNFGMKKYADSLVNLYKSI